MKAARFWNCKDVGSPLFVAHIFTVIWAIIATVAQYFENHNNSGNRNDVRFCYSERHRPLFVATHLRHNLRNHYDGIMILKRSS